MRVLIQRVKEAHVIVEQKVVGNIKQGILTFLGVGPRDTSDQVNSMVKKIASLRIFEDENKKMNRSLIDIGGQHLVISQFTLYGDCLKGNRPSFTGAAAPSQALPLYEEFIRKSKEMGIETQAGVFGADMEVNIVNDGPVTFWLESSESNT